MPHLSRRYPSRRRRERIVSLREHQIWASFGSLSAIGLVVLVAVWPVRPDQFGRIPTAIIVSDVQYRDSLAWLVTYVRELHPFTAFCRVVSRSVAAGDISDWPPNVNGKPTQAVVFGLLHPKKGRTCEILWTGKFPDLQPAMYWAAKKEIQTLRKSKGKWQIASRVLWQHDLTPEQAVSTVVNDMDKQLDRLIHQHEHGLDLDVGEGPMQPVDHSKVQGHYLEITDPNDIAQFRKAQRV